MKPRELAPAARVLVFVRLRASVSLFVCLSISLFVLISGVAPTLPGLAEIRSFGGKRWGWGMK